MSANPEEPLEALPARPQTLEPVTDIARAGLTPTNRHDERSGLANSTIDGGITPYEVHSEPRPDRRQLHLLVWLLLVGFVAISLAIVAAAGTGSVDSYVVGLLLAVWMVLISGAVWWLFRYRR